MKKFQELCGGSVEKSAILKYLTGCGKAQYISICKKEHIEVLYIIVEQKLPMLFLASRYKNDHFSSKRRIIEKAVDVKYH